MIEIKKETPGHISADKSLIDAINSISNGYKDSDLFSNAKVKDWKGLQTRSLRETFFNSILTMKQASLKTGIDRSNICWFVKDERELKNIWSCGKGIDRLTGARATFLTTNKDLAVRFFYFSTVSFWRDLPEEGKDAILQAIDCYLSLWDLGVFVTSSLSRDDTVLETWHRVQDFIDRKVTEK